MKINCNDLDYRFNDSSVPGCWTIEATHSSFPLPISIIWYSFQNNNATLVIYNMFTMDTVQRNGIITYLFKILLRSYPNIKYVVTDTATKKAKKWLIKNNFQQDETKQWIYYYDKETSNRNL